MMPAEVIALPIKRKRGRPKGSKNSTKTAIQTGTMDARSFCHETIDDLYRQGKIYTLIPLLVWAKNNL
jgi:hypothetical protein